MKPGFTEILYRRICGRENPKPISDIRCRDEVEG